MEGVGEEACHYRIAAVRSVMVLAGDYYFITGSLDIDDNVSLDALLAVAASVAENLSSGQ